MSAWYSSLPDADQKKVLDVAEFAVDTSLFGLFCVLDGVRPIENPPHRGEFSLIYTRDGISQTLSDTSVSALHEYFGAEINPDDR